MTSLPLYILRHNFGSVSILVIDTSHISIYSAEFKPLHCNNGHVTNNITHNSAVKATNHFKLACDSLKYLFRTPLQPISVGILW